MNKSTFLPDRVISIPWLAFKYEGVSLSQMIYSPNASSRACDNDAHSHTPSSTDGFSPASDAACSSNTIGNTNGGANSASNDVNGRQSSGDANGASNDVNGRQSSGDADGVLVHPSVHSRLLAHSQKFWRALRDDPRIFKTVVYKTLLALRRLHRLGVTHRDIKPENVLLSHLRVHDGTIDYAALTVKLVGVGGGRETQIDFGSAIFPPISALYPLSPSMAQCTKLYAPPEAENNTFGKVGITAGNERKSYDVWSVGVMMLEMIFGHKQFFECEPRTFAKFKFQFVRV